MPGRRVTVVAHELRGFTPVGGMGTATTFLALGLAQAGHQVEILLGKHDPEAIDPSWASTYASAGIPIRATPRDDTVEPWQFLHPHQVAAGLRDDPPEVVIAHDFGAPAYSALRLRQLGSGFDDTLFVVFCHGPRRWIADRSSTLALGDLTAVLGVAVLEQAALSLADVVVSPSAYLLDWMRRRGWDLPERAVVIPYFTESAATGRVVREAAARPEPSPLHRLVFFGRVDEKKGLAIFVAALNALDPALLRGLDVEFLGKTGQTWTPERIEALFSNETRAALASVTISSGLDRGPALERLQRPGTLAVMPSLDENSPNTVYECLEHGISFIASSVGGVPELIAPKDRDRMLFEPTAEGLRDSLRRLLADGVVPPPADAAFSEAATLERWAEVLELRPQERARGAEEADDFAVLENEAEPLAPQAVQTLREAQRLTNADVVTCGIRVDGTIHLFAGDAGGLGALANTYGTAGLVRRSLLDGLDDPVPAPRDRAWPLLARLAASGARIVSLPAALVERQQPPGSVEDDPVGALLALQELERGLPEPLKGAARLAAGLAAASG
jgi:glycosyltransferase involved in cell wall biosynthesis